MVANATLLPTWGDDAALQQFISDHALSHAALAQDAALLGAVIPSYDLTTPPDAQWHYQHSLMHDALNRALKITGMAGLKSGWKDADSFNDWMLVNYNGHVAFDQALGVA